MEDVFFFWSEAGYPCLVVRPKHTPRDHKGGN